jgi:hypothetical protein
MSQVKASALVSIAGLIVAALGSMVARAQVAQPPFRGFVDLHTHPLDSLAFERRTAGNYRNSPR